MSDSEGETDRWVPPKQDCAITFRNEGDNDIIVEPQNDSGNYEKAILVTAGHSVTVNLYPADYTITLYSQGHEKDFFPHFQRWGQRATSAHVTIGYDEDTKKFAWRINSILKGRALLFPPEELEEMNNKYSHNSDDNSEELDGYEDEEDHDSDSDDDEDNDDGSDSDSTSDSDSVGDDDLDPRYGLLDIVFVVDAAYGHTGFLHLTVQTVKYVLREIGRPFRKGNFRVALIVTRDYTDEGSEFELISFTSNIPEFEQDLDAIRPGGGKNGFCAFNAGMKEALGEDIDWRSDAERLVVVATAGVPHSIGGEKQTDDEVDAYTVSTQDPIRMARRMNLLNVKLVFLTDAQLISSQDSRIICFFRAIARMVPGAGVYQTGNPAVLRNYIAPYMADGWANNNTARVDEIRARDSVQRSSAYRELNHIYSEANTLTSSDVREKLDIEDPLAAPMVGAMRMAYVIFVNHGRVPIYVQCMDGNGTVALRNTLLGSNRHAQAQVETHTVFRYTLRSSKRKKDFKDRIPGNKNIDVSRLIS